MGDDRFFALVGALCVLLWLLSREPRVPPGVRRAMALAAYVGIAVALAYAVMLTVGSLLAA
jgi:bacteriorhodopsin